VNPFQPPSLSAFLADLPKPSPQALAVSDALCRLITQEIRANNEWISFARFMELALYAPGLGYYSAGSQKLGAAGDFTTAPELSPLFAACLARQLAQLFAQGLQRILELGAGSGRLACDLLVHLAKLNALPEHYFILELSAELQQRQRHLLEQEVPHLLPRIQWLSTLPEEFEGVIFANELLDATPTHRVRITPEGVEEIGVTTLAAHVAHVAGAPLTDEVTTTFCHAYRPASEPLLFAAQALSLGLGFEAEINLNTRALISSLTQRLSRGVMLLIDYGFGAAEFYHPQRHLGTLMCHYRHHAHDNPLVLLGLQDITAHVDFTAVTEAAIRSGAHLLGYTTQAHFLINCGITQLLSDSNPQEVQRYAPLAAQANQLLSPAEMGELFKVIAFGKHCAFPLLGFARGDKSHAL